MGVLGKEGLCGEDIDITVTFVRTGYVLERFFPSFEESDEEGCFVNQRIAWPLETKRV